LDLCDGALTAVLFGAVNGAGYSESEADR
jgi:hypothetical protein